MMRSRPALRSVLAISALLTLVSLACFVLPMYVIRPFRRQGVTELGLALFTKQIGPWVSIFCAVLCVLALLFVWTRARSRVTRSVAIVFVVLALGGAFLARVNIYELMFHHLDNPQFESAASAKLDPEDMVIAIRVEGVDRAYPIREMAYHHVVNDTVGGEPIAATY